MLKYHTNPATQFVQIGFGVINRNTINQNLSLLDSFQTIDCFD